MPDNLQQIELTHTQLPDPAFTGDDAPNQPSGGTAAHPGPPAKPGTPPAPASERPSWLPEKFKSPEEMAAAYKALEQ
jgi:hypothetical protein